MSLNTLKMLHVAQSLHRNSSTEEEFRSCANRAYYTAYHTCSNVANKYNYYPAPNKRNFTHQGLIDILINNHVVEPIKKNELAKLGYQLSQLKDLRVKADYNPQDAFSFNQSSDSLLLARRIINRASNI